MSFFKYLNYYLSRQIILLHLFLHILFSCFFFIHFFFCLLFNLSSLRKNPSKCCIIQLLVSNCTLSFILCLYTWTCGIYYTHMKYFLRCFFFLSNLCVSSVDHGLKVIMSCIIIFANTCNILLHCTNI